MYGNFWQLGYKGTLLRHTGYRGAVASNNERGWVQGQLKLTDLVVVSSSRMAQSHTVVLSWLAGCLAKSMPCACLSADLTSLTPGAWSGFNNVMDSQMIIGCQHVMHRRKSNIELSEFRHTRSTLGHPPAEEVDRQACRACKLLT